MTEQIWAKIDHHTSEIEHLEKELHGISTQLSVLENRFDSSIKNQLEGQARIETILDCLKKDLTKLNDEKLIKEGYEKARAEHNKTMKWLIGILASLIAGGAITFKFLTP